MHASDPRINGAWKIELHLTATGELSARSAYTLNIAWNARERDPDGKPPKRTTFNRGYNMYVYPEYVLCVYSYASTRGMIDSYPWNLRPFVA